VSFWNRWSSDEIVAVREKTQHLGHRHRGESLNLWQLAFILGLIEEFLESLPSAPPRGRTVPVLTITKEMKTMPTILDHATFSNLKTKLNTISTLPDGTPDPDAKVEVTSSDPSVGIEPDPAGGFFITTPLDQGAAVILSHTVSPNAVYEEFQINYSYVSPPVGHTVPVIGADVPDTA